MKIVVAYGLPGSGKSTLLSELYVEDILNNDAEMIFFDTPDRRRFIKKFFIEDLIEEDKTFYIDFLLQDPNKLLDIIYNRNFINVEVVIHQFIPDIESCLINDRRRGREIDATPTIKNMKINLLDVNELRHLYPKLNIEVITHNTYKEK